MDKMRSWESTRMENLMNKWVELNGMTDDERCANCLTDKIWFMLRYWQNNLTRAHHVYCFDQFNIALNMNMTMWQCIFKVSPNQIAVSQSDGTPKSTIFSALLSGDHGFVPPTPILWRQVTADQPGWVPKGEIQSEEELHPPKQTWNLKMGAPWKRRFVLETIISRFQPLIFGGVSGQIIIFHQPGFSWNSRGPISLTFHHSLGAKKGRVRSRNHLTRIIIFASIPISDF